MINVRRNNKIGAMGIDYTSIIPNVKLSIGMIYRTKKITNINNSGLEPVWLVVKKL